MNQRDNDCSAENPIEQIRLLYTELAQYPEKDFGCGAGADACIAVMLVGNEGRFSV